MPSNLNLAGSLKCSWLSNTLSGFSCFISYVKMPSCSALGCSNRSDKDPEKSLSFHNLPFRNEKSAEKWLDFPMHILKQKKLENPMSTKSLTDTKCWVQRQERGYQNKMLFQKCQRKVLFKPRLNKPSKILCLQWYKKSLCFPAKK